MLTYLPHWDHPVADLYGQHWLWSEIYGWPFYSRIGFGSLLLQSFGWCLTRALSILVWCDLVSDQILEDVTCKIETTSIAYSTVIQAVWTNEENNKHLSWHVKHSCQLCQIIHDSEACTFSANFVFFLFFFMIFPVNSLDL